jgi:hypothetical protein
MEPSCSGKHKLSRHRAHSADPAWTPCPVLQDISCGLSPPLRKLPWLVPRQSEVSGRSGTNTGTRSSPTGTGRWVWSCALQPTWTPLKHALAKEEMRWVPQPGQLCRGFSPATLVYMCGCVDTQTPDPSSAHTLHAVPWCGPQTGPISQGRGL